jgi:hypothetical protein
MLIKHISAHTGKSHEDYIREKEEKKKTLIRKVRKYLLFLAGIAEK